MRIKIGEVRDQHLHVLMTKDTKRKLRSVSKQLKVTSMSQAISILIEDAYKPTRR